MKKLVFKKNRILLDSSDKIILYDYFDSNNDQIIIFFHGCCGSAYDKDETTYQKLCNLFYPEFDCALYESSRFLRKYQLSSDYDFNNFAVEAFKDKSFEDEMLEADIFLNKILSRKKYKKIIFVGFSMGGLIASILSKKYNASFVFLFGSASYFQVEENLPIIGSLIERNRIRNKMSSVLVNTKAKIYMVRGSLDDTALQDNFDELASFFPKGKVKEKVVWEGVDHRFKSRNEMIDEELIDEIKKFIMNKDYYKIAKKE